MNTLLRSGLLASLLVTAACGPSTPPLMDAAMEAASPMDAAADVPRDTGRDVQRDVQFVSSICPMAAPAMGDPCSRIGFVCTYGDDLRPECRTRAVCMNFAWQVTAPRCQPYDASMCPATRPMNGDACSADGQFCTFPPPGPAMGNFHCRCTNCPVGGGMCTGATQWRCIQQADPGCPTDPPLLGAGCPIGGLQCSYDVCGEGGRVACSLENMWISTAMMCQR